MLPATSTVCIKYKKDPLSLRDSIELKHLGQKSGGGGSAAIDRMWPNGYGTMGEEGNAVKTHQWWKTLARHVLKQYFWNSSWATVQPQRNLLTELPLQLLWWTPCRYSNSWAWSPLWPWELTAMLRISDEISIVSFFVPWNVDMELHAVTKKTLACVCHYKPKQYCTQNMWAVIADHPSAPHTWIIQYGNSCDWPPMIFVLPPILPNFSYVEKCSVRPLTHK